ncbi:MAG: aconitate hydratase AcnA [Myxococcota bacterium]
MLDTFGSRGKLNVGGATYEIARLEALAKRGLCDLARLPSSIKVLVESLLRQQDGRTITAENVEAAARWTPTGRPESDVPFLPARVVLQDFTGVPVVVDLAAMRDAARALGADPKRINPLIRGDLVIDHSVQVDAFARDDALSLNVALEYQRNRERYAFLRWGQSAFENFRVVPPGMGICHQVNLEFLASVVERKDGLAFPDSCIGTDSHTTMINGLGVLGWGVGGIEAEAAMLGQAMPLVLPDVVGFRLRGRLAAGATATDLVLTVTEMLRKKGVVGKFVEFCGDGLASLSLPDRATIANMAPEYGATVGFFPVDEETLAYLRLSGRPADLVALVEAYCKEQGLWRDTGAEPAFSDVLELDLAGVEPSLAGPKRPQDRVPLRSAKQAFATALTAPVDKRGFGLTADAASRRETVTLDGRTAELTHGSIVIAAITSCTNTSNPSVMIGAGLLAKKAVELGLRVPAHVKTSLAPGSRVVMDYLERARLIAPLETLGFHLVGYGCTTCIGNSGPLPEPIAKAVKDGDLVAAAVLSGNRNFEGRIHPQVRANYLASPPLVVAYALAGRMDVDLATEPLGVGKSGAPVYLRDVWPSPQEVLALIREAVRPEMFRDRYARAFDGDAHWAALGAPGGDGGTLYAWDAASTYIRSPPYFEGMPTAPAPLAAIRGARVLGMFGDSVTTDHISPAGAIAKDSPAALYLAEHGVEPKDWNSYGARRGNHEVMIRGTFANVRLKNLLVPGVEGPVTVYHPSGARMAIYDAAIAYAGSKTPLVIIAGKEYGTGSSRDWAAKGTRLLGVRAVLAESYERIHRSNLVGMGVLPLEFLPGQSRETLSLDGTETYEVDQPSGGIAPRARLTVRAQGAGGRTVAFEALARIDTAVEADVFRHGGILPAVLRQLVAR